MPDAWTGRLIGRMHNAGVTYDDLAAECGVGKAYISMILNSKRSPKGAEKRLCEAFENIVSRRKRKEVR